MIGTPKSGNSGTYFCLILGESLPSCASIERRRRGKRCFDIDAT